MVQEIRQGDVLLAIIIRKDFQKDGVHFFTPPELSQQVAYMKHPKGKQIDAHVHKPVSRQVVYTQEVLVIKRGKLKVNLYDEDKQYVQSELLEAGDVIMLVQGGHGFEVMEELEMIEVKQGPYANDDDKERFTPQQV